MSSHMVRLDGHTGWAGGAVEKEGKRARTALGVRVPLIGLLCRRIGGVGLPVTVELLP